VATRRLLLLPPDASASRINTVCRDDLFPPRPGSLTRCRRSGQGGSGSRPVVLAETCAPQEGARWLKHLSSFHRPSQTVPRQCRHFHKRSDGEAVPAGRKCRCRYSSRERVTTWLHRAAEHALVRSEGAAAAPAAAASSRSTRRERQYRPNECWSIRRTGAAAGNRSSLTRHATVAPDAGPAGAKVDGTNRASSSITLLPREHPEVPNSERRTPTAACTCPSSGVPTALPSNSRGEGVVAAVRRDYLSSYASYVVNLVTAPDAQHEARTESPCRLQRACTYPTYCLTYELRPTGKRTRYWYAPPSSHTQTRRGKLSGFHALALHFIRTVTKRTRSSFLVKPTKALWQPHSAAVAPAPPKRRND
jgi:hypothetical protein